MLGGLKQSGDEAGDDQARPCGLFDVAVKTPGAGEEEEGDADVSGDQAGVSEDVGIERDQSERREGGPVTEVLAGGKENNERKGEGEETGGQAHLEDDLIAIAVVAGEPLAAVEVGFDFEFAVLERWNPERTADQRRGGKQLGEGRVFGVEAVVAGVPHHVAGEAVIAFVKGGRFTMDDEDDYEHLYDDERTDSSREDPRGEFGHDLQPLLNAD